MRAKKNEPPQIAPRHKSRTQSLALIVICGFSNVGRHRCVLPRRNAGIGGAGIQRHPFLERPVHTLPAPDWLGPLHEIAAAACRQHATAFCLGVTRYSHPFSTERRGIQRMSADRCNRPSVRARTRNERFCLATGLRFYLNASSVAESVRLGDFAWRAMQRFETAQEAALALRPDDPVYCFRPEVLKADCAAIHGHVPGQDGLCGQDQWRKAGAEDAGRKPA